jgi:hypothetical protein
MEHLSETYWCAGWLDGLEHQLWRMAHGGPAGFTNLLRIPTEQELSQLRELSQHAGGWWCWPDGETNVKFLSLEEWDRIYDAERPTRVFEVRPNEGEV